MGSGECCIQKKRLIIRATAFYKAYRCVGKYFGSMNTPKNILARKRIHLIAMPVILNKRAAILYLGFQALGGICQVLSKRGL